MTGQDVEPDEVAEDAAVENGSAAARIATAPYMPGGTFTNSFAKYAEDGLPDVFDKSYFGNISGSTIAQIRGTLRYFDLIDDQYVPTPMLRGLVDADEETRKSLLKMMVEDKYADALALSQSATSGQLAKIFNERGLTGATIDKAISFYLHMLDYVGIPYSNLFKKRRSTNGGTRRRAAKKTAQEPPPPPPPAAKPKVTMEEEKKAAYLDALLQLSTKDGTDATERSDIFDRIERALGIVGESKQLTGGGGSSDLP